MSNIKTTTMDENFKPYGEEWKKEISKMPKTALIDMAAKLGQEKVSAEDKLKLLNHGTEETEVRFIVDVTNSAIQEHPGFWVVKDQNGNLVALVTIDEERFTECERYVKLIRNAPIMERYCKELIHLIEDLDDV